MGYLKSTSFSSRSRYCYTGSCTFLVLPLLHPSHLYCYTFLHQFLNNTLSTFSSRIREACVPSFSGGQQCNTFLCSLFPPVQYSLLSFLINHWCSDYHLLIKSKVFWSDYNLLVTINAQYYMFLILNLIIVQQEATVFSLLYFCRQLYVFRVLTPIIRSSYNCNYSFWHSSTGSTTSWNLCSNSTTRADGSIPG